MKSGHYPGKTTVALVTAFFAFLSLPIRLQASSIILEDLFTRDSETRLFNFTMNIPGSADLRSDGYAQSTTSIGQMIPSGGFDTVLTLFSGSGTLTNENDKGTDVAIDPSTGLAADARITTDLTSRSYILALTQYNNFATSLALADGFNEDGHSNFTAGSTFTSAGPCPGNLFQDISDTAGRCRNGDWTVDFVNASRATPVPELLGAAMLVLGIISVFQRKHLCSVNGALRGATVLLGFLVLWPVAMQAQTDFSQIGDVLAGKRQLVQDQDLIMGFTASNAPNTLWNYNFTTSNGKINNTLLPPASSCSVNASDRVRTVFAGRFYQSNRDQYIKLCRNNKLFLEIQFVDNGRIHVETTNITTPAVTLSAVVGDFLGTGYEDLAVGYTGGFLFLTGANADGTLKLIRRERQPMDSLIALAAGDFNGDGKAEIAGLRDNGALAIYTIDPQFLIPRKAAEIKPSYDNESGPITFYSLTAGKFTAANRQQLVLSYATNTGSVKMVAFDFAPSSLQPIEQKIFTVPGTGGLGNTTQPPQVNFIKVQAARFAWQGLYDQLAFQYSNTGSQSIRIYQLDPLDLTFQLKSSMDNSSSASTFSPIAVGNFDNSQVVNGQRQYNPNLQIAYVKTSVDKNSPPNYTTTKNVLNVDPEGFGLTNFQESLSTFGASTAFFSFYPSTADLQARSYILGDPTKVTIQGAIQPNVIAGMPPMHIDYIVPAGETTPEIFNFSADPVGFHTSYQTSNESRVEEKNTDTISWSAGAKLTAGASVSIGNPDIAGVEVKNTFTAAQDLKGSTQKQYGNFQSQSYSRSSTTGYGDFLMFSQQNFYIWVYPVIGRMVCPASKPNCSNSDKLPMTIQFSVPGDTKLNSLGSATAWYQPPWEPGNILSYPANLSQLKMIYPNLQLLSKDSYQWFTDLSKTVETTTWNVGSSNGTTSTLDKTFSYENDFSVSGKASAFGVGVGANLGINISGSSGFSSLRQATTAINQSTGIGVTKSGGVKNQNLYPYGVTSYLIGRTKPGSLLDNVPPSTGVQTFDFLQAVFAANPLDSAAGSWWQQNYRDQADAALNHPSRWSIEIANTAAPNCVSSSCAVKELADPTNPWLSPFYYMRGLFLSSAANPGQGPLLTQATAGTKLSLLARVYNYSFASMPPGSTVHARFYAQPWDPMKNVALLGRDSFLLGEDVLSPVPPFSDAPGAPLNWVLARANFDTTGYDHQFFTFWAVVWIQNANGTLATEITGHGLKSIPGKLTSFSQVQTEEYSNNLGFWKQTFYVAPPSASLDSGAASGAGTLNIGKIQLSANRISVGQPVIVSALVSAENQDASNAEVFFWDRDPDAQNADLADAPIAFDLETPSYIEAGASDQVSAVYRPKTCGTHQVFISVELGTPQAVIRRSAPIQVDCGAQGAFK